ncbi:MAG: hypothetical protein A2270_07155 [Elusimicrobia bacterium RIFOXYA12_FULL_51_18]|nr:MAG: hypothetical protein A2270_07155 [Elusimicrobia bacterium RIFOXYA12_FULL_51_18]OGS28461.1 MAG: hypothetical protein A2218_05460 [Elusimicrobia bacterium RIFOXYA2_FULL_53_38]
MDNVPKSRMRLRFTRLKGAWNMSHLEQIRALRDMAAASGLDCCPARNGKNLVPKMSFGPALSAGYESLCEYADLYLAQTCKEEIVGAKLSAVKSGAFSLVSVKRVPVYFPSIEASVSAARYLIEADFKGNFTREAVDIFLARKSALYAKPGAAGPGATLDVRPVVMSAELDAAAGGLRLVLRVEPGKNVKPVEVLGVMAGGEMEIKRVVREELYWLDSKGGLEVI